LLQSTFTIAAIDPIKGTANHSPLSMLLYGVYDVLLVTPVQQGRYCLRGLASLFDVMRVEEK